jgi:hypothetical protein
MESKILARQIRLAESAPRKKGHGVAVIRMIWIVAVPVRLFPTDVLKPGFSL